MCRDSVDTAYRHIFYQPKQSRTPLHSVSSIGHEGIANLLLERKGVSINNLGGEKELVKHHPRWRLKAGLEE